MTPIPRDGGGGSVEGGASPEGAGMGSESAPRFEFRSFGQDFDRIHHRMARLSVPVPEAYWERTSDEVYVVSRATRRMNLKLRGEALDLKRLDDVAEGLERWSPQLKKAFPVSPLVLRNELFPALGVPSPDLDEGGMEAGRFLDLARATPGLQVVRVWKRRFGYLVHGTICEYADVLVNGARVVTVGCESVDPDQVRRALADMAMTGLENINYPEAIKRVIGMVHETLPGG